MRYAIVGGVGEILMFLGKIMISAATAFAFYCLVTYVTSIAETIFEPILLLVVNFSFKIDRFHYCLCCVNSFYGRLQYRYGYSSGLLYH